DAERLRKIEPHVSGIKALYSPRTGIIDFTKVAQAYARKLRALGGTIRTSTALLNTSETPGGVILQTSSGDIQSKYWINCGGLYTDRLAQMATEKQAPLNLNETPTRIIPFRGEYYRLAPESRDLIHGLIYPVPDSTLPFLGVHFTPTMAGEVEVGPNAVLAFAREGYQLMDFNLRELWQTLSFRGFWAMARIHWKAGLEEYYRSLSKRAFVRALQQLVPEVQLGHLISSGRGVRAQAVSATGQLLDDFVISSGSRAIHVINAPSPGATASLAIGSRICEIASKVFS
ncbi:MAG: L-2-hydroxyglutarate oxidase, partial [Deltaproteobacteria bacterium]|nr:L-2-hydroxyglutarate oxidase [Deltaproteobacteria bacterium]